MHALTAQVMVDIYPFDLNSDCNCPTFSKQGNTLAKSFFLEIAPGLQWSKLNVITRNENNDTQTRSSTDALSFRLAAGAGFDIGISDLLTVTPWVQGFWSPGVDWNGLNDGLFVDGSPGNETATLTGIGYGIRFLFRPDYQKPRF